MKNSKLRLTSLEANMPNLDPELQKQAVKEALREWLDEQWNRSMANFGKWVFTSLLAAAFAGVVYLSLIGLGWRK